MGVRKPIVYLEPGLFTIDPEKPILLKRGVSLMGSTDQPSILSVKDVNTTGTIEGKRKENTHICHQFNELLNKITLSRCQ